MNLRTLTAYDGRMWWLAVAAVALALTALAVCPLGRISAHYGLSLLGIGDLGGGLSGELFLRPQLWQAVGLGALWGMVAGFLGALPARLMHRRGTTGMRRTITK